MKESIAQAFIVGLILFFFGVLLIIYFGTVNYSKAFKAKNKIINVVEKYGDVAPNGTLQAGDDTTFIKEIEKELNAGGYQTINIKDNSRCNKYAKDGTVVYPSDEAVGLGRAYDFCLIRKESQSGPYYQAITFMKYDIPILGGFFSFPVRGETKVLCENVDVCVRQYSNSH